MQEHKLLVALEGTPTYNSKPTPSRHIFQDVLFLSHRDVSVISIGHIDLGKTILCVRTFFREFLDRVHFTSPCGQENTIEQSPHRPHDKRKDGYLKDEIVVNGAVRTQTVSLLVIINLLRK